MEIKDRLKILMERENITPKMFAETIGVQQSTLSHILNDRNKPSLDFILKVHQIYNYVNLEWLLYGKGEIQNRQTNLEEKEKDSSNQSTNVSLPLFNENQKKNTDEYSKQYKIVNNQIITGTGKHIKKITEIKIFFDDNTYETFKPEKQKQKMNLNK